MFPGCMIYKIGGSKAFAPGLGHHLGNQKIGRGHIIGYACQNFGGKLRDEVHSPWESTDVFFHMPELRREKLGDQRVKPAEANISKASKQTNMAIMELRK